MNTAATTALGRYFRPSVHLSRRHALPLALSLLLLGCYLTLALKMRLDAHAFTGANLDGLGALGSWHAIVAWYLLPLASAFLMFGVMLWLAWRGKLPAPLVFAAPAAFGIALLFVLPMTSTDTHHYLASARSLWVFGDNPITEAPNAHPFPAVYAWSSEPSPYGPGWHLLTFPIALTGDHFEAGLLVLKAVVLLAFLGCIPLVYRVAEGLAPGRGLVAVVLFAWNPYFLVEIVGNGHNEPAMLLPLILSVFLLQRGQVQYALPALAAACLVKFVPLLVAPVLALYLWRNGLRRQLPAVGVGLLLSLIVVVAAYAPFWEGASTFDRLRRQLEDFALNSPAWLLRQWAPLARRPGLAQDLTDWGSRALLGLVYLAMLVSALRARSVDLRWFLSWSIAAFLTFLFGVIYFQPWYFAWPLALLVLMPSARTVALALALSVPVLFMEPFARWAGVLAHLPAQHEFFRDHTFLAKAGVVALAFGAPLAAVAVLLVGWARTMLGHGSRRPERAAR